MKMARRGILKLDISAASDPKLVKQRVEILTTEILTARAVVLPMLAAALPARLVCVGAADGGFPRR